MPNTAGKRLHLGAVTGSFFLAMLCIPTLQSACPFKPWTPSPKMVRSLEPLPPRHLRPESLRHLDDDVYRAVINRDLTWFELPREYIPAVRAWFPQEPQSVLIGHTNGNNLHILWKDDMRRVHLLRPFGDEEDRELRQQRILRWANQRRRIIASMMPILAR